MAASGDLHGRKAVFHLLLFFFFLLLFLLLLPALSASSFPAGVLQESEDRPEEKLGSADREAMLDPEQSSDRSIGSGWLGPNCSLQHRILTNDYASFDPSPTLVEPPFKAILN